MKHIHKTILLFCAGLVGLSSCAFDEIPFDKFDASFVFSSNTKAEGYVLTVYSGLPYGNVGNVGYNITDGEMLSSVTDESMLSTPGSSIVLLSNGTLTPRKSNPDDVWSSYYQSIRDIHQGLENLHYLPAEDDVLREHLTAELKFLQAYFYFELVKRYGGVPIVDRVYSMDEDLNIGRSSFEDCVDYIVDLCDEAQSGLQEQNNTSFGRASKGAAQALKVRVLLYAASPLFNGEGYDGSSNPLVCYGSYDEARWKKAAEAAAKLIESDVYKIHTKTPVTNDLKDAKVIETGAANYRDFFLNIEGNKEIIFSRSAKPSNQVEKQLYPYGSNFTGGKGKTNPSQQMVDAYGMVNGLPISDSESKYDPRDPFANRDPRLNGSIIYNGLSWNGVKVETFTGGLNQTGVNATKTGYYLSKFCADNIKISGDSQTNTNHCFPLIRYAEVLLNYAEAVNEAYGPDSDPYDCGMTARDAVKAVRGRVLRPSDTDVAYAVDKEGMREAVRAERRVELAFENFRYFDLKRWMVAGEVLNQDIKGMTITKASDGTFTYDVKESCEARIFPSRMYLYPLPNSTVVNNSAIKSNNPLW